jgi:hypothetical protein
MCLNLESSSYRYPWGELNMRFVFVPVGPCCLFYRAYFYRSHGRHACMHLAAPFCSLIDNHAFASPNIVAKSDLGKIQSRTRLELLFFMPVVSIESCRHWRLIVSSFSKKEEELSYDRFPLENMLWIDGRTKG